MTFVKRSDLFNDSWAGSEHEPITWGKSRLGYGVTRYGVTIKAGWVGDNRGAERCYWASKPPSTANSAPVTYDDSSDARYRTAFATSSAVPSLVSGILSICSCL